MGTSGDKIVLLDGMGSDPDAPEGAAFVRYLAVRCFAGDTIKWSEMI